MVVRINDCIIYVRGVCVVCTGLIWLDNRVDDWPLCEFAHLIIFRSIDRSIDLTWLSWLLVSDDSWCFVRRTAWSTCHRMILMKSISLVIRPSRVEMTMKSFQVTERSVIPWQVRKIPWSKSRSCSFKSCDSTENWMSIETTAPASLRLECYTYRVEWRSKVDKQSKGNGRWKDLMEQYLTRLSRLWRLFQFTSNSKF